MKQELLILTNILRQQCPEFLDFLTPGINVSQLQPEIILPTDLIEFYQWSAGIDVRAIEYRLRRESNVIPDSTLFYLHSFEAVDIDSIKQATYNLECGKFLFLTEDGFGSHFLASSDGLSNFVHFLEEGSEIPIPAFSSMSQFIETINFLFESRNFYYELEGRYRKLKEAPEAWEMARRMNETDETREYWSEGLE